MSDRYIGSNFDDFLAEEGLLPEVEATASKRVLIYQLERVMDRTGLSIIEMAQKMNVTQAVIENLLDPNDSSVNLQAIA
ncbi:MAG: XRE family transcriptional regulator [Cyanobacteria bacterium SBLK]|nr:XRE family transcriptional regulator [Cyanobacteria bacterium SBLK]